jgi:hypothetical protein
MIAIPPIAPLLAQGDFTDVIAFIVFIVIGIVSWLVQALGNKNKQGQPKGKLPRPRPRPQGPPQQAGQGGGRPRAQQGGDRIQDEIGDFLRQAAQRRKQPGQAAPGPEPHRAPPPERPMVQPLPEPPEAVVEAQVIQPERRARRGDTGARGPDMDAIRHRQEQLQREMAEAERESQRMLEERFTKQAARVGAAASAAPGMSQADVSITRGSGGPRMPAGSAAAVRKLFAHPPSLRQAIIASEVLQRPSDRWR